MGQNTLISGSDYLDIDTSTAIRIFLKWTVMENGMPFRMILPKALYNAEREYRAMIESSEGAGKNGVADISLGENHAEIKISRNKGTTADE